MNGQPQFELRASGTGWFLGRLGVVSVANMGDGFTDESSARYLAALDADLVRRGGEPPSTVFYDTVAPLQMSSARRRALAEVLERHRDLRARVTIGYALSTPSALGFTVMSALYWLAPPPYPTRITSTALAGFRYLAELDARIDPDLYLDAWSALMRELGSPAQAE